MMTDKIVYSGNVAWMPPPAALFAPVLPDADDFIQNSTTS